MNWISKRQRNKRSSCQHPLDHRKAGNSRETLTAASLTTQNKAFDSLDHNKLWKILQEWGVAEKHTCLLQELYTGQGATVRNGHGTTSWVKFGKGEHLGCIFSPCLFNSKVQYIMLNAGLDEAQAGIQTVWRNISNLRYADNTTLIADGVITHPEHMELSLT